MPAARTNSALYLLSRRVIRTGLRNSVAQMWIKKVQIADVKIPPLSGNGCLYELPSPQTREKSWWWSLFNSHYTDAKC